MLPPPVPRSAAPVPRRSGIRGRLLAAFVFLALSMGAALGVVGHVSFDALGAYLVGWHARPVMEALMEAEKRAWEAEDSGHGQVYSGEDLALVMHWRFLVGKQVPPAWRAMPAGLHFINNMEEFILIERRDDVEYVLNGGTGGLQALKARLRGVLLLCAFSGLALAVALAVVLSRRLARPLSLLTLAVENRPPQHLLTPAPENSPGPGPWPAPEAPAPAAALPIPMTELHDEVGVLARAIAAREAALQSFVRRESSFTGDVSHELRTPLTVMQGGLEILELRLASLPQATALLPVVGRLLRTTARMSATVRTLLLLARRPEELEVHDLDCGALLLDMAREMERDGLLRLTAEEGAAEECQGHGLADGCKAMPASGADQPPRRAPVLLQAHVAAGVRARGHRELAGIIFKNLLDNACQYTENGRALAVLDAEGLRVRNSGRIPDGLDVFARGVRCGHKASGDAGSGLGLSLALRACERLGWGLHRDSAAPEAETVFCVRFAPAQEGENR